MERSNLMSQMRLRFGEVACYLIGFLSISGYTIYAAYKTTHHLGFQQAYVKDSVGAPIVHDFSPSAWTTLKFTMLNYWWILIIFVSISKVLRNYLSPLKWSFICGMLSISVISYVNGTLGLYFYLCIVAFHFLMATMGRKALWISHVGFLLFASTDQYYKILENASPSNLFDAMYAGSCIVAIHSVMICNDSLCTRQTTFSKETFSTVLHYVLYPPALLFGSIVSYRDFAEAVYRPIDTRPFETAWKSLRLVFYYHLLHHTYTTSYNAFFYSPELVHSDNDLAFAGCAYLKCISFYLFYILAYGWPHVLGRVDGFKLPDCPRCIFNISSFHDIWKTFDQGLYNFIKLYVYIPLGGNRFGIRWQIFASFMSFAYVTVYHGATISIVLWASMNFAQILAETFAKHLYFSEAAAPLVARLSPAWTRRLLVLFGIVSIIFSSLAFSYFEMGFSLAHQLLGICGTPRFWALGCILCFCLMQLVIECRARPFNAKKIPEKNR